MISVLRKPRLVEYMEEIACEVLEGDYVELDNGIFTFWCLIANVNSRGYYDGIVSSHLPEKVGERKLSYRCGELIRFHRRHIVSCAKNI
jgi:hypothetical protein